MSPDLQLIDCLLLVGILVFTFTAFLREWLPIDVVALTSLGLLLVFNLVTPEQAISGFANPAVITVMMMFILSEALVESGVVNMLSHGISRVSGNKAWTGSLMLLGLAAFLSGFINTTATVAILIPVALHLAKHFQFSPSKLLLPLSYMSIMGGTSTLIGTSTNLLVSSMAADRGLPPMSVFELMHLGWILLPLGLAYNLWVAPRLLRSRSEITSLTRKYELASYLTEVKIPAGSPLVGRTVVDERISDRFGLNVLEILRGSRKIAIDLRNTKLEAGDVLIVRGEVRDLLDFRKGFGLLMLTDIKLEDSDLSDENNALMEVQLSPRSGFLGRTLKDIDFRRRFSCFVLAISRQGDVMNEKVANIPLRAWDTLLTFGPRNRMEALIEQEDFTALQELNIRLRLRQRWWVAPAVFLGVLVFAAAGVTSILKAAILGVVSLLVTRRLTVQRAYQGVNWTVIFLLASLLPLGIALEETGLARLLGEGIAELAGGFGPMIVIALIFIATSVLTELISNNAAAVLMVPIAFSTAATLGVSPKPLVIAVAISASTAFLTPMGYQTNTMVYNPGGYRFRDYLIAGAPLKLTYLVVCVVMIPRIWPL